MGKVEDQGALFVRCAAHLRGARGALHARAAGWDGDVDVRLEWRAGGRSASLEFGYAGNGFMDGSGDRWVSGLLR